MELYGEKRKMNGLVSEIDRILANPVEGLQAEELAAIQDALENRKGHLDDDLNQHNRLLRSGDATDILYELLAEGGRNES